MQLRGSVQRLAARSHDFLDAHRVRLDPDAQHADLAGSREVLDALRDGYQRFGDIIDALVTRLNAHLAHEETDGLPLIDASLTPQEWQRFAQVQSGRLRGDEARYMPWLLNGADPQTLDAILGSFPPPLLAAYRDQWKPKYAALDVWNETSGTRS